MSEYSRRPEVVTKRKAYYQTPEWKETQRKADERRRADPIHRMKMAARASVKYALRMGRIERKPCEKCGAEKAQAHHEDYSKPLDVHWLCSPCHILEHKK